MIPPYILQKRILNTILVKINLKGLHMINWIKGLLGLSLESQLAELATIQTKVYCNQYYLTNANYLAFNS